MANRRREEEGLMGFSLHWQELKQLILNRIVVEMLLLGSDPGRGAGGNEKNWTSRDLCSTYSFHHELLVFLT